MNPFITSDAVLGDDFFGRDKEITEIKKFLKKKKEHNFLIYGQRRIGKTSLLLKIKEFVNASRTGKAVFFDLQNKAKLDISEVLFQLASQVASDLDAGIQVDKESFSRGKPEHHFANVFLPRVLETLPGNCQLILLFDEFDSLGELEGVKGAPKISNIAYYRFIPFIADIKKRDLPIKFIFAVGRNYKDLDENHYGQITKAGFQIELLYFNKEELKALIKASDSVLPFKAEAVERIYAFSHGHPFFSQCLASSAFDEADLKKRKYVTASIVTRQLEPTIRRYSGGVIWLWRGFPPSDRIVLYLMAMVKEGNQKINEKTIREKAIDLNLSPAVYELDHCLERLLNLRIIKKINRGPLQFDFYVEYFRKWVVLENSPEKIGTLVKEINPEVEHYLRNGRFYYESKDYTTARDFFLKVLEIFPSHYESLFCLGHISLNLGEASGPDEALEWFSRAYHLNPYGTKDEYLYALKQKQTALERQDEETEGILMEIQRITPEDVDIIETLVERFICLKKDISRLRFLSRVKQLKLAGKGIEVLPGNMRLLKELITLDLSNNKLWDISPIGSLNRLEQLNLSGNKIEDISPLAELSLLTNLELERNRVTDLSPLGALSNLIYLNLSGNQVSDMSPLVACTRLKQTILTVNRIEQIPAGLFRSGLSINWGYQPNHDGIFLEDNPLVVPPVAMLKQGTAAVLNYFRETETEAAELLETRVIIVGDAEVGKTTLMKKLKDPGFQFPPGMESTTHGINIQPWELDCTFEDESSCNVKINFWDFGGREIYYSTHQFFLSRRALYLLVWEVCKDDETPSFDYWLNTIRLLGGDSPVIIVLNKSDVRMKAIDEASLSKKFPNIIGFHQVSCLKGQGIPALTEQIRNTLSRTHHLRDKLPKAWLDIRNHFQSLPKDYVSIEEFFHLCEEYDINEERAEFLSAYLHDLGIIFHYRKDASLENIVVLNPDWITNAIYSLLGIQGVWGNRGMFHLKELKKYWDTNIYPRSMHLQLVQLLEKFGIFLQLAGTDFYVIPALLPANRPEINFEDYREKGSLRFEYHYDFMPEHIIGRSISRLYHLLKSDCFWKHGMELEFESSRAFIFSVPQKRRIKIVVSGSTSRELLWVIRNSFDDLHTSLNMKADRHFEEMIPCNCSTCSGSTDPHPYSYQLLKKFNERGIYTIPCIKSLSHVSVKTLLEGFEYQSPERRNLLNTFITAAYQLQGRGPAILPAAYNWNAIFLTLLEAKGFNVRQTTYLDDSSTGKYLGEMGILIEAPNGEAIALIEAFSLRALERSVISANLTRFFGYDPSGVSQGFIIVYSEASNFTALWKRYLAYIQEIDFQYRLLGVPVEQEVPYTEIKVAQTRHSRSGRDIDLYHIFINMKASK